MTGVAGAEPPVPAASTTVVSSAPAADTAAASPAGPAPITATSLRSRSVTTDPVYGTRTRPPKAVFLGVRFPLARSGAALHNEGVIGAPLDFERCYRAVESRDARFDGWFITAVRTTGIYCRPSCPTPVRPKRENVSFY